MGNQNKAPAAGDLRIFEGTVFSQNGEDGILEEILRRIGTETRYFVEFGVESGIQCNCARLVLEENWKGLFIEGDTSYFQKLSSRYHHHERVRCTSAWVTSANIESLLEANEVPLNFDVLSVDIDGNDYWVWSAIKRWHPRVVVIEYNATYRPPRKWVMKENPNHQWDGTNYFGASLVSLANLGERKGYILVATNSTGVNAFFVRADLVHEGQFLNPGISHYHYSPPRYGPHRGGHPPRHSRVKPVDKATDEIASLIRSNETFILVDQNVWGPNGIVAERRALPFLEHDERYWGPPADDQTAIRELERLRRSGANFIIFLWPAFWWLDYYQGFRQYLVSNFHCALRNDRLVAFDLNSKDKAHGPLADSPEIALRERPEIRMAESSSIKLPP